jgi:hypothetical protein
MVRGQSIRLVVGVRGKNDASFRTRSPKSAEVFRCLLVGLGMSLVACQGVQQPKVPMSREDGIQILRCYVDAFQARFDKKPVLDSKDVRAAEPLFQKEEQSAQRACKLVWSFVADPVCFDHGTLQRIAEDPDACKAMNRGHEPGLNNAKLHDWNSRDSVKMMRGLVRP